MCCRILYTYGRMLSAISAILGLLSMGLSLLAFLAARREHKRPEHEIPEAISRLLTVGAGCALVGSALGLAALRLAF